MLIFSYGSNICITRLKDRVPSAKYISNAKLIGYSLKLHKVSSDESAKANAYQTNNDKDYILGVIFEIDSKEKSKLDKVEGLGNGYEEKIVSVFLPNNETSTCQIYIANKIDDKLLPYDWYMSYIIIGAKDFSFPKAYVRFLNSIPTTIDINSKRVKENSDILDRHKQIQNNSKKPLTINKHSVDDDEYYNPQFYKFAPYEIVKQNYPFIGEIISLFNSLENLINDSLIEYINEDFDAIGWIVISELPFSAKLKLWKRLLQFILSFEKNNTLKDELKKECSKLSNDIEKLMEIRNKVAHADWDNIGENLFAKVNSKLDEDTIRHHYVRINETEFEKIISEFEAVEQRFAQFTKRLDTETFKPIDK